MEIAVGMFAALGTSTAAAGTAAAGGWLAGTTATTAAGATVFSGASALAGSTALSVLSGVLTAGSMLSTIAGGAAAVSEAETNAALQGLQGTQEVLASEETALRIKRDLLKKVGETRVAFAGSGLTIGSGAEVERDLTNQADFETGIERTNATIRRAQAKARQKTYRDSATMSLVGAAGKILGQAGSYGVDLVKRG